MYTPPPSPHTHTHTQSDRNFNFITTTPPTSYFLKAAAGITKGAARPGHQVAGRITLKHIYEIATVKSKDPAFAGMPLESVCKTLVGSARSLGIQVTKSWSLAVTKIIFAVVCCEWL